MTNFKTTQHLLFAICLLTFESAMAVVVTIDNPPQNYRTYTRSGESQNILHTGSTRGLNTLSFHIPDRYALGLNPNTEWKTILENWRASSPRSSNNPTSRNNISYFPFTDSTGHVRFIALNHLLERQQRYPNMSIHWQPSNTLIGIETLRSEPTPTPSATTVTDNAETLYIGDSHSTNPAFYNTIMQRFGADTNYYASCGANSNHWRTGGYTSSCGQIHSRTTQPLTQLQQNTNAEKVIINLGDNHISWSGSHPRRATGVSATAASDFRRLVETLPSDTLCYWVGPVWGSSGSLYSKPDHIVNEIYSILHQSIGSRCTIIDCRDSINRSNSGDGLHYNDSTAWAQCIADRTSHSQEETSATESPVLN